MAEHSEMNVMKAYLHQQQDFIAKTTWNMRCFPDELLQISSAGLFCWRKKSWLIFHSPHTQVNDSAANVS
jgi:hypothetical protein